jgi:hypothetical protein
MKRRKFINPLGTGSIAGLLSTTTLSFKSRSSSIENSSVLKIGIVADVHKNLMPDAN